MKKLIFLSALILISCSKEDNSGLLDQISDLQSQNSQLLSEINSLSSQLLSEINSLNSQVSQIPALESQLNQAILNYESSIITIEGLEEQIDLIKLNYLDMSREISRTFEKLNNFPFYFGSNVSTFYWGSFVDENGNSRGSYMFEFDNDNLVTTIPYWTGYTESFNPTLNVYKWNGDCWVYIDDLSFRENGRSVVESVITYSDNSQLSTVNYNVDAQSLGLTSGYDNVGVRIVFDFDIDEPYDTDAYNSATISVYDSNNSNIFSTGWTELNIGEYSDIILEVCPD